MTTLITPSNPSDRSRSHTGTATLSRRGFTAGRRLVVLGAGTPAGLPVRTATVGRAPGLAVAGRTSSVLAPGWVTAGISPCLAHKHCGAWQPGGWMPTLLSGYDPR
jgi:hypothetical protein